MTKVLSFNLKEEKQTAVKLLCMRMGFEFLDVSSDRQHETLGKLCGLEGSSSPEQSSDDFFSDEMLVFYQISKQELNEFLDLMRSNDQTVIHKAVVTDYNRNWSAAKVFREIDAEYQRIKRMKKQKRHKK